jgi:hypothetical protein
MADIGNPTGYWAWASGTGWTGADNANGALDMQFNPSVDGVQNDMTIGLICSAFSTNSLPMMVSRPGSQNYIRAIQNGSLRGKVNQTSNTTSPVINDTNGWVAAVRDVAESLNINLYRNSAVAVDIGNNASIAPTDTVLQVGNSGGTYGNGNVLAAFVGQALTGAELADLNANLDTLMTAFGN